MQLTSLDEAAAELMTTVESLLIAVLERRIARPSKVFGWTSKEYQRVCDQFPSPLNARHMRCNKQTKFGGSDGRH